MAKFDMGAHMASFWDGAHRRIGGPHVRPKGPEAYSDYLDLAGPFLKDVAAASDVLDIGPGFGLFLASLEGKGQYAVDVSSVSRDRVRERGGVAFKPGEVGKNLVDLATCLSVVQHCDLDAARVIFKDVARALRPGGLFYLNAINGKSEGDPVRLLARARFAHNLDDLISRAGFSVLGKHVHSVGAARFWVLRLRLPL